MYRECVCYHLELVMISSSSMNRGQKPCPTGSTSYPGRARETGVEEARDDDLVWCLQWQVTWIEGAVSWGLARCEARLSSSLTGVDEPALSNPHI